MNYLTPLIYIAIVVYLFFYLRKKYIYFAYYRKGETMLSKGLYTDGLALIKKGFDTGALKPMRCVKYAFAELKYGDLRKAKIACNIIITDRKYKAMIKYEAKAVLSLIHLLENDAQTAFEIIEKVYEKYRNTNIYCSMGYLYNLIKPSCDAVKFNEEAYQFNREHPVIIENLAEAYYLDKQFDKATTLFDTLMLKKPTFPEAYYDYAVMLYDLCDYEKALSYAEQALYFEFHKLTTVKVETVDALILDLKKILNEK